MDTSRYGSDPGGVWAAADRDSDPLGGSTDPDAWRRAVEADFPADGDVMCDPDTFMPHDDMVDATLGVLCFSPELAESALARAAARMMTVAADGREYTSWTALEELRAEDEDAARTPDYISEPQRRGDIVGISRIDTLGRRYTWMFRTFLRIVAEELRAAGAVPAKIIPFPSRAD